MLELEERIVNANWALAARHLPLRHPRIHTLPNPQPLQLIY